MPMEGFNVSLEYITNGYVVRGSIEPCIGCELPMFFMDFADAMEYIMKIVNAKVERYERFQALGSI